jgi:hypothetical protein
MERGKGLAQSEYVVKLAMKPTDLIQDDQMTSWYFCCTGSSYPLALTS